MIMPVPSELYDIALARQLYARRRRVALNIAVGLRAVGADDLAACVFPHVANLRPDGAASDDGAPATPAASG